MQLPHPRTLVVLAGPTASGKTALGIWLAKAFGTEILSADSRQCYRELEIGVARPSPEELHLVPHHFIATHSIQEIVNAGTFAAYGLKTLNQLFKEHSVVLAVGGTGLYIKALTEGIDAMPSIPASIRETVIQQYQQNGLEWLQSRIALEDPLFWEQAEKMNPQRLMRALEFIRTTGTSIVAYRKNKKQDRGFQVINIGLATPRDVLYQRINTRVDIMMAQGLEKEVRTLYPFRHLNALQTVGYREWYPYFEGKTDLLSVKETIQRNTRHYAKRQITWFKKQEDFKWFSPTDKENILSCIKSQLNGPDSV
ncbi:tRNA (adenosine(37)-N6)-dimethylallyltransferase MiaA [Arachidicoccus terrestris]|uniref:tRNA (adenosine(37)-N6)-dimethylallyltransferase MiaA n=1 Tax=Arachidicoccus terrestris TaxID=2875539 RepID=UPI001CC7FE6E|nr:tRNA (adenosine(37)-N6)-dimethylallyltransferase MiaA [Arachidicoccus terrestris]UAY54447.1 tRNA (adenosine(37)-N6)-dimethylallyltransferase MiaA [Arachidicoccus terrestris]